MIQVIERIGKILDIVASSTDGVPLREIEEATSLNKGTLCNLLKSLCEIDYVEKKQSGIYSIGRKLRTLAYPQFINETLFTLAAETARRLSEDTRESGLVVIRQDHELQVIARHIYDQSVVINAKIFDNMPGFHTAAGHIFLAFDPELDIDNIYQQELPEMYPTLDSLKQKLADIRKKNLFQLTIPGRHAVAISSPVFRGNKLAAALAMVIPDIRFDEKNKVRLCEKLSSFAKKMTTALS